MSHSRKHNRRAAEIADAPKNPPPVNFAEESCEGETFKEELFDLLDAAPNVERAVSWMMTAIANIRAAAHADLKPAEIQSHLKRISKKANELIETLDDPVWWEMLIGPISNELLVQHGYWPTDRPASPENIDVAIQKMIDDTAEKRLRFLRVIRDQASQVADSISPKDAPKNLEAHAMARQIKAGIDHAILPFAGVSDPLAQDLFKLSCRAAKIRVSKPITYYAT